MLDKKYYGNTHWAAACGLPINKADKIGEVSPRWASRESKRGIIIIIIHIIVCFCGRIDSLPMLALPRYYSLSVFLYASLSLFSFSLIKCSLAGNQRILL